MPKALTAVAFVAALGADPNVAQGSVWYGQPSAAGADTIGQCLEWPMSFDKAREAIEGKFGACSLPDGQIKTEADDGLSAMGVFFTCGTAGSVFMFFRSRENCRMAQDATGGGRKSKPEDYAPADVKNRTCATPGGLNCPIVRWEVAYTSCFTSGGAYAVGHRQIQGLTDLCSCVSEFTSQWEDSQLAQHVEEVGQTYKRCFASAYGSPIPETVLAKMMTSLRRAWAPRGKPRSQERASGVPRSTPKRIRIGAAYRQVMSALVGFPAAEKTPTGDDLDVTYKDPRLLAYPDADGACRLEFTKGRLASCEGCDPARFACESE